jgi:glycine/D-amino acid oxidase-like deaminating enzyme
VSARVPVIGGGLVGSSAALLELMHRRILLDSVTA